jgi:hypothetical protein
MGDVFSGIGNAISGGINAIQDLAKGDVGGALSAGLGAAVNGFMATQPELSMVSQLGGMLGGLVGQAGGSGGGPMGALPGLFGNIADVVGGALQNPLGALGNLIGGGGGGAGGAGGLPSVGGTQSGIQGQLAGLLDFQKQNAQFQIQFTELTSLIKMLQDLGTAAARNMA